LTRHHVDEVKDAVLFLILVECDTLPPSNDAQLERRTPLHINRPIFLGGTAFSRIFISLSFTMMVLHDSLLDTEYTTGAHEASPSLSRLLA